MDSITSEWKATRNVHNQTETLTWKKNNRKAYDATLIIFFSVQSSTASKQPCSFIVFDTSKAYKKMWKATKQTTCKTKKIAWVRVLMSEIDWNRLLRSKVLMRLQNYISAHNKLGERYFVGTCRIMIPTLTAATGTKLLSIHSSPARKQPRSKMCFSSPGCMFFLVTQTFKQSQKL